MRRSSRVGIGVIAVLLFAACTADQDNRPLAPTEPLLAPGGGGSSPLCSGKLASDIAKDQKLLFLDAVNLGEMVDQFGLIKTACPIVESDPADLAVLLEYYRLMVSNRSGDNSAGLSTHLFMVSQYATGTGLVRSPNVFGDLGGAAVLTVTESSGDAMISFDKGAKLSFAEKTEAITASDTVPFGQRFFTLEPLSAEECGNLTGLRLGSRGAGAPCYDIQEYPHAVEYTPAATLTLCMHKSSDEPNVGIVHEKAGYGDEVLPPVDVEYACGDFHSESSTSWLERNGGPLGRALAGAYRFIAPRTLLADDVGESGSIGAFSKVGAILTDIFRDDFSDPLSFNPNPSLDFPDLGDDGATWIYSGQSPGFIRIENDALVLSQGQGACTNCPVFKLLGEIRTVDETNQVGETDHENNGSFDVIWTSVQTKPSVKEGPFVLLNGANGSDASREIARLSYVSQSGQNRLVFKIPGNGNSVTTIDAGPWVQNVRQTFKITVNLNVLNDDLDKTVSLSILNPTTSQFEEVMNAQDIDAPRAASFKHIGYILTGIDAGIIGSDNWKVTRLPDIPPP